MKKFRRFFKSSKNVQNCFFNWFAIGPRHKALGHGKNFEGFKKYMKIMKKTLYHSSWFWKTYYSMSFFMIWGFIKMMRIMKKLYTIVCSFSRFGRIYKNDAIHEKTAYHSSWFQQTYKINFFMILRPGANAAGVDRQAIAHVFWDFWGFPRLSLIFVTFYVRL